MRYLLGILMLWGFVAVLIFTERLSMAKGLLCGAWFACLLLRHGRNDPEFKKWMNRLRRWREFKKLEYKFESQHAFFNRKMNRAKYAAASAGLTEEKIRAWISDEMEKEMAHYGLAVPHHFLTKPGEIRKRVRKQAIFHARHFRFFLFLKVAWMPFGFRRSFVKKGIEHLIQIMQNPCGEVIAQEYAEGFFGTREDSCVFYPQAIKEQWMYLDLGQTFSPETVARKIADHETRHCAQYQLLRQKGGAALVKRVMQHKQSTAYGTDVLEYDAYRCQLGENRSIDEFLKEALIEVGWLGDM